MKKNTTRRGISLSQMQVIAIGFAVIILAGTLLLMLPVSTRSGEHTTFIGALLTSTSASCVTGLIAYDTFNHWSLFGQLVILVLIQLGGLGFMTFNVMFLIIFKKNIGLKTRSLVKESVSAMQYGGIVRLVYMILKGTVIIELTGALLLSVRFIPVFGFIKGIYYSLFHAISAFCNAGFDLMGCFGEYSSLTGFAQDGYVTIVISALIIIGGLGFIVWEDMLDKKLDFRRYRLHSKLVLVTTAALIAVSTLIFFLLENNNTLADFSMQGKIYASLFDAVTPRTAGFNTTDTAALSSGSKILTMILMLIGGSPGSTAGGIKTTTLAVMIIFALSGLRNSSGCNVFGRRIDDEDIKKASRVIFINMTLAVAAAIAICGMQPYLNMSDILFEVFSAIGTAGMSTGVTRQLSTGAMVIISLLMYMGRIGSMTFGLSFLEKRSKTPVVFPVEKINIG